MHLSKWFFVKFLILSTTLSGYALAQTGGIDALPEVQESLTGLQAQIQLAKPEYDRLRDENQLLNREMDNLSERLVIITEKIQVSESHIGLLEDNIKRLDKQEQELSIYLQTKRSETAKVLSAIGRLSLAPDTPLGATDGETETVEAALVLNSLTKDLKKRADQLSTDLKSLTSTRQELQKTRTELGNEKLALDVDRQKLENLLEERKNRIEKNNTGLAKQKEYIEALSKKEQNVESLISKIQEEEKKVIAEKRKELQLTAQNMQNDSAIMTVGGDSPEEIDNIEIASLQEGQALGIRGEGGILSPQEFSRQKGTLQMPVAGNIVYNFGAKDMTGKVRSGLTIRTRSKGIVASPVQGEIIFSGKFRDYNHVVIIKITEDYHIFVAGLGAVDVSLGQKIMRGEPVGRMPAGAGQSNLYLEMRHNRQPIDPMPWLAHKNMMAQL